jgi:molybdate transport system substrate-binding protein
MHRLLLLAILSPIVAGASVSAQAPSPSSASIRIAAASDLRFALEETLTSFRTLNPGLQVEAAYGSSGNFFAQIREGAPFDIFLSADVDYVARLSREGLGEPPFPYAIGRLALVVRKDSGFDPKGFADLLKGAGIRRLAIANPAHAPYGRAAEATLRSWKIYDAVAYRLVLGESVSQAVQYVDAGAAQAGLVALSLARVTGSNLVFAEIAAGTHPPLEQSGLVLKRSAAPEAARAFQHFLTGDVGRGILARYGFGLPKR